MYKVTVVEDEGTFTLVFGTREAAVAVFVTANYLSHVHYAVLTEPMED